MNRKRILCLVLCLVCAVTLLAGCGSAKKKPAQAGEFEDDPFAEDEPESAPKAREGYHVMFGDEQKSKRHVMFEDEEFDDPFSEQEKK